MKITIVYDNEVVKKGLISSWGFSCLIDTDTEKVLFDTGDSSSLLSFNMVKLGIDPRSIDKVVLSHPHMDHTGGLPAILNHNRELSLYIPKSFPSRFKAEVGRIVDFIEVDEPTQICNNVFTTGELGWTLKEQSLILRAKEGNVVVMSCAHPGVKSILDIAKRFGRIKGIIGGLHGFNEFKILRDMRLICPCHCTQHKKELAKLFSKAYVECGAGREIRL